MPLDVPFAVSPFAWYRVAFRAKARPGGMIAAIFSDAAGRDLDADHYTGLDPSEDWQPQEFCFRAKANATHARIRLNPASLADSVRDVAVEPVSRAAVAAWADRLWATMPPLPQHEHEAPPPATFLARGGARAEGGCVTHTLRVVMLGDSIVNDTGNSPWDVLVERHYPGLRLEVVTSVRGGTGCWYYKDEGRVKPYVLDYRPDLLMIGGISHNNDTEAIRSVVRQTRPERSRGVRAAARPGAKEHCRVEQLCNVLGEPQSPSPASGATAGHASSPHVLLMTGAFGKGRDPREDPAWSPAIVPGDGSYRSRLEALAAEEGCGFFDLEGAWGAYLRSVPQPYAWFMRDEVHANTRGHMLLARILERFFAPRA